MIRSGVYKIVNLINNKIYFGSALDVPDRFCTHKWRLRNNIHPNKILQNSWNKYGEISFKFEHIITCEKKDILFYEQMMMDSFSSYDRALGYNIRKIASSNSGVKYHENTRKAMKELWCRPEFLNKILKYKSGDRYGKITLLSMRERCRSGGNKWLCKCDCGSEWLVATRSFNNGIQSCGCIKMKYPKNRKSREKKLS